MSVLRIIVILALFAVSMRTHRRMQRKAARRRYIECNIYGGEINRVGRNRSWWHYKKYGKRKPTSLPRA